MERRRREIRREERRKRKEERKRKWRQGEGRLKEKKERR